MIKLSLATGLRISEILALRWEELEPEQGAVKLRVLDGKGGKDRILFMSPLFYEELLNYAKKHSQDRSGFVFTTTKGNLVKDAYIRRIMRQKAIKAGIEKRITFHSLNHTALTRLYEKTKGIRLVQEVAGHAGISTRYILIFPGQIYGRQ